jgi:hypothetical protein
MDIEHYVAKYKEHEERKASTKERNDYWRQYSKKDLDPETSFDMGKYT